jgi:Cu+-exporting ATPase
LTLSPKEYNYRRFKMTRQATLKVTGMSCSGCAASVEKALKGVSGVSTAKVNLKAGKANVEYDPDKADEKKLADAVKKAGYGVG